MVTVIVLVGLRDFGGVQICLLQSISILYQAASVGVRPLLDTWENTMAIVNELFVSTYLYVMMTLSAGIDGNNDVDSQFYDFRDMCGLALVGVVAISIFLNLAKLMVALAHKITLKLKQRCRKSSRQAVYGFPMKTAPLEK